MHGFRQETEDFKTRKSLETAHARQIAALHLACGIDLSEALSAGPAEKLRLAARLERAIERERLKAPPPLELRPQPAHSVEAGAGSAARHRGCAAPGNGRKAKRRPKAPSQDSAGLEPVIWPPCACVQDPSSWPTASGLPRSSGQPSDSWRRATTSPGTGRALGRSESSDAV